MTSSAAQHAKWGARDQPVDRGHVSCGLCDAVVVRWSVAVAGSSASASGDDPVA